MIKKRKYSLHKDIFSVVIIPLLMTSCLKTPQRNYKLEYREKDYTSFMYDPLDWTYEPDTVYIEIKEPYEKIEMSISEFNELLNTDKEYITINNNKISSEELKEYSSRLLANIKTEEYIYPAKILMIISEGTIIISCGLTYIVIKDTIRKKIKQLKNELHPLE